jgi:Mrp family chromosome partitioning ATPase
MPQSGRLIVSVVRGRAPRPGQARESGVATILSVHSFRGGTGKSNTTANLAAVVAGRGKRVGVIDTDIQSPGIHVLFGLEGDEVQASLNDYLWHDTPIRDVAMDVRRDADGHEQWRPRRGQPVRARVRRGSGPGRGCRGRCSGA